MTLYDLEEKRSRIWKKDSEAAKLKKQIEEKMAKVLEYYQKLIDRLTILNSKYKERLYDVNQELYIYSTFSIDNLSKILIFLLGTIEGEKFYSFNLVDLTIIVPERTLETLIENSNSEGIDFDGMYYNCDSSAFLELINKGTTSFYINGEYRSYFRNYPYLCDFIKDLINYRIENKIRHIMSFEELFVFANEYLLSHPDIIKNKNVSGGVIDDCSYEYFKGVSFSHK